MSDRIAVFNHGRVEQVGTPAEVYESPANTFVAGFVGTSNVIAGDLAVRLWGRSDPFTVRPEKITVGGGPESGTAAIRTEGTVAGVEYLGMFTRYRVDVGGQEIIAVSQNLDASHADVHGLVGSRVHLGWTEASCRPIALSAAGGGDEETSAMAGGERGERKR